MVQAALAIGQLEPGTYQLAARVLSGTASLAIVRRAVVIVKGGA
jgi:hypothetical protein